MPIFFTNESNNGVFFFLEKNNAVFINILPNRSNEQRQEILTRYKAEYEQASYPDSTTLDMIALTTLKIFLRKSWKPKGFFNLKSS